MKVLIADDDNSVLFTLKTQLKSWGYSVISCKDGNEAVSFLNSADPPRIAILDWMMNGYTGIEIADMLKDRSPLIYVILFTAKTAESDLVKAIENGAHCFLTKPISPVVLRSHIAVAERLIKAEDKLQNQEREIRFQCYEAIADLAEVRHNITGSHMKRITIYSRLLAERLGMDEKKCEEIEINSRFHDIGKVGMSDTILLSPDTYTKYEKEIMKTHTAIGYDILLNVPTLKSAALIARHHHERWDGGGYPDGLKGEQIPIEARIVTLADIYDALRSKREYKDTWTHEETVAYIEKESGSIFDPHLVEVFLTVSDIFDIIFNETSAENQLFVKS
ncbi:MAG: response regulator [Spirochaetia bacterium]|nr:response regulator [Spirochaetia bacterium]